jgi:hypothetical protein
MTHDDKGHYAKKHSPDRKVKPEISDALKKQVSDGKISCTAAHKIAGDLKEPPPEVGFTMDILELRIEKCQMGLFGYTPEKKIVKPVESVPRTLENAILEQVEDGRLSCKAAWDLAEKLSIKKMGVSSACETLKIKISPCQLGAF